MEFSPREQSQWNLKLFIKEEKRGEIIHFTSLISQKLAPAFFDCEFMGSSLGMKRYQ